MRTAPVLSILHTVGCLRALHPPSCGLPPYFLFIFADCLNTIIPGGLPVHGRPTRNVPTDPFACHSMYSSSAPCACCNGCVFRTSSSGPSVTALVRPPCPKVARQTWHHADDPARPGSCSLPTQKQKSNRQARMLWYRMRKGLLLRSSLVHSLPKRSRKHALPNNPQHSPTRKVKPFQPDKADKASLAPSTRQHDRCPRTVSKRKLLLLLMLLPLPQPLLLPLLLQAAQPRKPSDAATRPLLLPHAPCCRRTPTPTAAAALACLKRDGGLGVGNKPRPATAYCRHHATLRRLLQHHHRRRVLCTSNGGASHTAGGTNKISKTAQCQTSTILKACTSCAAICTCMTPRHRGRALGT